MSAVLAAALVFAPQNLPGVKYWTLDDFTVGTYTVVLTGGGTDNHGFSGLDKSHCVFGQRRTYVDINSNPNHTTLTLSVGGHEQRFDSPKQVAWQYDLQYGYDGDLDMDFMSVDRFIVDCDQIPDIARIYAEDVWGRGGANGGWLLKPGGIYFRRSAFTGGLDWRHIVLIIFQQDFATLPNPLSYSVTRFYAKLLPGASPPAMRVP